MKYSFIRQNSRLRQPFGGCQAVAHGSLKAPVSSNWSRTTPVCNIYVFHTPGFQQHSTAPRKECHANFKLSRPIDGHNSMYSAFYTNGTHFRLVVHITIGLVDDLWA
jgi:hypothetical protein